ncbi:DUF4317 domain-containing protein [Bittarella massiliensis (ex Durand et al. 2017)]|uniref:DUF4317 domain-containing protein n=1 Tax=Bittarella massiliensis (ex Durand et al. 2017) TaxID=1720313 RepID=UPI001AA0E87F|nr:DUF4317 domain-containing protein [Bittarella massiliensis (ex Durand et al. 2017)]MBO1679901.1 DUF4317 domain-containing protein [Bittarella massiliensis (ex Durand et al. 2017)]
MTEREIAEIRRRYRPEKTNITHLRGCYVNEKKEIVSQFDQPLSMMSEEEAEKILATLKRTLSGAQGRNLFDVEFATQQVVDSEEHRLLMSLRSSGLGDEEAVQAFLQKVIASLAMEGSYLILLAHETYDVPYRSADGGRQDDASDQVYTYFLCSICPVKLTTPALSYFIYENKLSNRPADWLVSPPELGFLFPAFDSRCANIYSALYYTRNPAENHQEFAGAIFNREIPMPATEQKETFQSLLGESLGEDCSLEVVQAVEDQLTEMIEAHKERKEEEPLAVSKYAVKRVLEGCGVPEERLSAFTQRYDEAFGPDLDLSPRNLVNARALEVATPDVTVKVNPERGDLVETRVIDGVRYILIRAEEGVQVNGIDIHIS